MRDSERARPRPFQYVGCADLHFGTTMDAHKIPAKCATPITDAELEVAEDNMCELLHEVRRTGIVSNATMD
jgi:hypothetical protein